MNIRQLLSILAISVALASCGKQEAAPRKAGADPCASVKAAPPYQTYEQALESCRNNQKLTGTPDVKRSNIQITNH